MRVCLVTMPWQSLESPSLPIGLLKASAVAAGLPSPVAYHANLRWAEYLLERSDGLIGPPEYIQVAEEGLFDALGDWVFAGVLERDPEFGVSTLEEYARDRGVDIAAAVPMRAFAADFVELVAAEVLALEPDVIGFTSTFMQNVPSLAAARRIGELAPQVKLIFGGGNCDGIMGAALHRNYPFVDFVVRGEGEDAFPMLLKAIQGDGELSAVPGLSWRDATGVQQLNPMPAPIPAGRLPVPDFDDWFDAMGASEVNEYIEPKLVLETARGCWWGEKHQCTFCGLNGSLMTFRAKSADRVLDELTELVGKHKTLDVIVVDNIIDNGYFTQVLPRIEELGWDLRIHYEVKSNLTPSNIDTLRRARVAHVQPGIESLVSPVLKLMDKGVAAVRNVRTLRDCESAGLTVSWNWLYGFPGERWGDYEPVLEQVPALMHLQPPVVTGRIFLERFSPYFENPALGFPERTTSRAYRHAYSLPEDQLHDMVYLFDTEPQGLTESQVEPLRALLARWSDGYHESTLEVITEDDGTLTIRDRRVGWPERDHHITDPLWCAAYVELAAGHSVAGLLKKLPELSDVDRQLAKWKRDGLVFVENDQWLSLATQGFPIKVLTA